MNQDFVSVLFFGDRRLNPDFFTFFYGFFVGGSCDFGGSDHGGCGECWK